MQISKKRSKVIFSRAKQRDILAKAKKFILDDLLPDNRINAIIIFGSFAKGTAGAYDTPVKRRAITRRYSDIDVLLLVENNFKAGNWNEHATFELYMVYNRKRLLGKYVIQYLVCRRRVYENPQKQREAKEWGVPLSMNVHKKIVIYQK